MTLPTAFGPRERQAYAFPLVPGGPWALLDPGPAWLAARRDLEAGLAAAGLGLRQLKLIALTSLRPEAAGMAWELAGATGAALAVGGGRRALATLEDDVGARIDARARLAGWAGAPAAVAGRIEEVLQARAAFLRADAARTVTVRVTGLVPGGQVRLAGHAWELRRYGWPVLPGQNELWHPPSRSLLAGGLLPREGALRLPFKPGAGLGSLNEAVGAWRRLGREAVDLVLGDHGAPIRSHRLLIARRLDELRADLEVAGRSIGPTPVRPWDAFEAWSGQAVEDADLPEAFEHFLTLLQQLERRRLVTRRGGGGVARFARANRP